MGKEPKERIVDLYKLDFLGKIVGKHQPLLARTLATATDKTSGNEYQCFHLKEGEMMVQSKITGKKFVLGWNDIVTLAKFRGIDRAKGESGIVTLEGADYRNVR